MRGRTISLQINKARLLTGAYEHVVQYEAEIELISGGTSVEVQLLSLAADFPEPDAKDVETALENIHAGIESIVFPKGLGAHALISDLYVHPVDFIPRTFAEYTKEALQGDLTDIA